MSAGGTGGGGGMATGGTARAAWWPRRHGDRRYQCRRPGRHGDRRYQRGRRWPRRLRDGRNGGGRDRRAGVGHLHRVEEHRQDRVGHWTSQGGRRDEFRQRDQVRHHLPAGRPGRNGEVPDFRLGRGGLLSGRLLEPGRHGRDRFLGILRRRRRHARRARTLARAGKMGRRSSTTSRGPSPRTTSRAARTTRASRPRRSRRTDSRAVD